MTPLVSRTRLSGPGRALLTALTALCPPSLPHTAHAAPGPSAAPGVLGAPGTVPSGGTSAVDLILPVAVLVVAVLAAGHAYVRRRRRAVTRTTPGATARRPSNGAADADETGGAGEATGATEADETDRTGEAAGAAGADETGRTGKSEGTGEAGEGPPDAPGRSGAGR